LHRPLRTSTFFAGALACALACALTLAPLPASACVKGASVFPNVYEVDPALRATDSVPPSAFTAVTAFAYQSPGTVCKGNTCTSQSCGDSAAVELSFAPPTDDQTPSADLGYRIDLLEGEIPQSMLGQVGRLRPLTSTTLVFDVSFQEVATLDAMIALVAVDRAGNESPASAPIHVMYSGCVKDPASGQCFEYEDDPVTCSVAHSTPGGGAPLASAWWLLAALGLLLARTRSSARR
jgi:hypothetical protein